MFEKALRHITHLFAFSSGENGEASLSPLTPMTKDVNVQSEGGEERRELDNSSLEKIASTIISLYNQAPQLSKSSKRMSNQAHEQAQTVATINQKTNVITQTLNQVVDELEASSKAAFSSLGFIEKITETSKFLAINASIEAARAGDAGRSFGVVASEMHRLALQTEETSVKMARILEEMRNKVNSVVKVVGNNTNDGSGTAQKTENSVHALHFFLEEIAQKTAAQAQEAKQVNEMSEKTRNHSEALLMQIGKLRFGIHSHAKAIVEELIFHPELGSGNPESMEPLLIETIESNPFIDLLYVTGNNGIQITRNIGADASSNSKSGENARGQNWSNRPWFRSALDQDGPVISDFYISVTTKRFCFTVSQAILNGEGEKVGVLGADIDFEKLLNIQSSYSTSCSDLTMRR